MSVDAFDTLFNPPPPPEPTRKPRSSRKPGLVDGVCSVCGKGGLEWAFRCGSWRRVDAVTGIPHPWKACSEAAKAKVAAKKE